MNQVNGTLAIEQAVLRIQPNPRFLRIIKFIQSIHHVAEIRYQKLSFGMGKGRPRGPTGHRCGRHSGNVGNVGSFESPPSSKVIDNISYRTCHDYRPSTALTAFAPPRKLTARERVSAALAS